MHKIEPTPPYWQRQQQLRRALISAETHDEIVGEVVESRRCPNCLGDLLVSPSSTMHIGDWCADVPASFPTISREDADRVLGFVEEVPRRD